MWLMVVPWAQMSGQMLELRLGQTLDDVSEGRLVTQMVLRLAMKRVL